MQRPQEHTCYSQNQEKRGNHPSFRISQTLTPGELDAVALAFSADIFPIPILVAKVAIDCRSAGGANSQKIAGFLSSHTFNLSIIEPSHTGLHLAELRSVWKPQTTAEVERTAAICLKTFRPARYHPGVRIDRFRSVRLR